MTSASKSLQITANFTEIQYPAPSEKAQSLVSLLPCLIQHHFVLSFQYLLSRFPEKKKNWFVQNYLIQSNLARKSDSSILFDIICICIWFKNKEQEYGEILCLQPWMWCKLCSFVGQTDIWWLFTLFRIINGWYLLLSSGPFNNWFLLSMILSLVWTPVQSLTWALTMYFQLIASMCSLLLN